MVKKIKTTTTVTEEIIEDNTSPNLSVYILFDRSGSMVSTVEEAVSSTNAYTKALPENTKILVASFDNIDPFDIIRDNVTVSNFKDINITEVSPRGMTPLYDSTGKFLNRVLLDNPERAVVVIQTDGGENNSKEFSLTAVKALIKSVKKKKYEIVFLGNDFDQVDNVSSSLGIVGSSTLNRSSGNYHDTSVMLAGATRAYAASGQSFNFTPEVKAKAVSPSK